MSAHQWRQRLLARYEQDIATAPACRLRNVFGILPSAAASVAVGLAITETWQHCSWQTLVWGWLALPAVAAGALTRLWPRIRQAWSAYTTVRRQ